MLDTYLLVSTALLGNVALGALGLKYLGSLLSVSLWRLSHGVGSTFSKKNSNNCNRESQTKWVWKKKGQPPREN